MKHIFCFITIFVFVRVGGIAQNNLFLDLHSGVNVLYSNDPFLTGFEGGIFGDLIYWRRTVNFAKSIGITYESKPLKLLGNEYYLITEGNISHRKDDQNIFNFLLLSNNLYLPKKVKDKKLRFHIGIRNSFLLANLSSKEVKPFFNYPKHFWGITTILNYSVSAKLDIGLSSYFDSSPIGDIDRLWKVTFRTAEIMLKLSYQIK